MFTPATRTLFASSLRTLTVPRTPFNRVPSARTVVTLKDVKVRTRKYLDTMQCLTQLQYTVTGTATGAGRNGHVESNGLKLNLATPKALGGTGKGENPEQLFAMGYSGMYMHVAPVLGLALTNFLPIKPASSVPFKLSQRRWARRKWGSKRSYIPLCTSESPMR